MSEYMLHSNFGLSLTWVIGGNFGAYTFILPLSLFPKYLSTFLDVLSTERILKHNKNTLDFPRTNSVATSPLEWFYSNSVSKVVLNAAAKSSCFNVRIIKNSIPVVEDGANKKGSFF